MIRRTLFALACLAAFAGVAMPPAQAQAAPVTQFAACGDGVVLGMPYWYNHLPKSESGGGCTVQITKLTDIWVIVLNILQAVITIAGYVAAGLIIWGGIKFIKSQGDPGQITDARDTIINASIGLVIVLASVAIVNFVASNIA